MKIFKHKYYSEDQIKVVSKIDPDARVRQEINGNRNGFICMECGSVDMFSFQSITAHNITVYNGELSFEQNDYHAPVSSQEIIIPVKDWFDHQRDKGQTLMPTCGRCGGAVVERKIILEWCEKNDCIGCMYCGKVTSLWKVEMAIDNCSRCNGGEWRCEDNCTNRYMRKYYGIHNTVPRLLEAPEDYEE
jgi:hypothetical protein